MAAMTSVVIGMAVAGAVAGGVQSMQANEAADDAEDKQKGLAEQQRIQIADAMHMQIEQVGRQHAVEQLRMQNESAQIRGRMRVLNAEAGTGTGGSFVALQKQAAIDEGLNSAILEQNYRDMVDRIESDANAASIDLDQRLAANLANIDSTRSNPLLASFSGGMGGASTGMNIATGWKALNT